MARACPPYLRPQRPPCPHPSSPAPPSTRTSPLLLRAGLCVRSLCKVRLSYPLALCAWALALACGVDISRRMHAKLSLQQEERPTLHMSPAAVRIFGLVYGRVSVAQIRVAAIYRGSVNDPTPFPPPSKTHGSHHWAFERILSAGLVPLTVAGFVTSGTNYPIIDGLLGVSLVMHSHIGVRLFPALIPLNCIRNAVHIL